MPLIIKGMYLDSSKPLEFIPVIGRDYDAVCIETARLTRQGAKMLEWRMDGFEGLFDEAEVRKTLESLRTMTEDCILLATVRTAAQGGQAEIGADKLAELYDQIAQSHCADLIDVEYETMGERLEEVMAQLRERGALIALSCVVDFRVTADGSTNAMGGVWTADGTSPEKWEALLVKMHEADPDAIRLVQRQQGVGMETEIQQALKQLQEKYGDFPIIMA